MRDMLVLNDKVYPVTLVETNFELEEFFRLVNEQSTIVYDLETDGLYWYLGNRITGVAIYFPVVNHAYYISFRHPETSNFPLYHLVTLGAIFAGGKRVVTFNGKFDLGMSIADGISNALSNAYVLEDVMLAAHLLDENRYEKNQDYKLKNLARQFIDPNAADEQKELKQELKNRKLKDGEIGKLPASLVYRYAAMDVILTWELRQFFIPYMESWHLIPTWQELNYFQQTSLLRMEINGFPLDREQAEKNVEETQQRANELLAEIHTLAGYPLNPNSSPQVSSWLGIPNSQRLTLEALHDPRAEMIIDYKILSRAAGTFINPYLKWSSGDGRIHTSFNQLIVTGRLSARDPNLQQVPREAKPGKRGYNVKNLFIAPPGYNILYLDYASQELRLIAHYANEQMMRKMLMNGDVHQYTADNLGVDRDTGKTSNFSFAYGMGAKLGAVRLKRNEREAKEIINGWHNLFPNVRATHRAIEAQAKLFRDKDGNENSDERWQYIRLPDGRIRHFGTANPNYYDAWNTLVQGTGAIVARRGIQRITDAFPNDIVAPSLTVHDSFMAFVKEEEFDRVVPEIYNLVTDFPQFNPPMDVDLAKGQSWGTLQKIEKPKLAKR